MKANGRTTRRRFIATAGAMAVAATHSAQQADKPNPEPNTRKPRWNSKSRKLDAPSDQPDPNAGFKLRRRMPGWRPDTIADENHPENREKDEHLFPEEALRESKVNGHWEYLPVPFADNTPNDAWILGHPLPPPPQEEDGKAFHDLLVKIGDHARRYNAALYWMRRLHFSRFAPQGSVIPPHNCHGDKQNAIPNWKENEGDFKKLVREAEDDWKKCVKELNQVLEGTDPNPSKFKSIWADMIEVNGYIASMRIVADERELTIQKNAISGDSKNGDSRIFEVPGSSSSHISISSAFSSPR